MRRFSHKLMLLVEAVLAEVAQLSVRPDRFAVQQCARCFRTCMHAWRCLAHNEWSSVLCTPGSLSVQTCSSDVDAVIHHEVLRHLFQANHCAAAMCFGHSVSHYVAIDAVGSRGRQLAAKRYANTAFEQPYNRAAYTADVLLEARRWHTAEYEAVVGGLRADDLTVRECK